MKRHTMELTTKAAHMNSVHLQVPDIRFNEALSACVRACAARTREIRNKNDSAKGISSLIWRCFSVLFAAARRKIITVSVVRCSTTSHTPSHAEWIPDIELIVSLLDKSDQQHYDARACVSTSMSLTNGKLHTKKTMTTVPKWSSVMRFVFGSIQLKIRILLWLAESSHGAAKQHREKGEKNVMLKWSPLDCCLQTFNWSQLGRSK